MMKSFFLRPTTTRHFLHSPPLTSTARSIGIISSSHAQQQPQQQRRNLSKSPGNDPLELLKQSSENRQLCDEVGLRKKDQHWVFGIATSGPSVEVAPTLKTIDFQRITSSGIDFIRRRGKGAANLASSGKASTILCSFGKYRTGETVEQWLAEGQCEQINLVGDEGVGGGDLLKVIPSRSIVEIVASMVVKEEEGKALEEGRALMEKHSHYMEVVQRTRQKLEKGELTNDEIDKGIMAVRFVPYRMERLIGGPDKVMWERWQWQRATGECPEGTALWNEPQLLLPY